MRILRNALLILVLLYGALFLAERLTTQELTSVTNSTTQETASLMWKPQFLRGNGLCYLDLKNSKGQTTDTAILGTLDTAFNALQQYGQLTFQDQTITIGNRNTGDTTHRFTIQENRLIQN